MEITSAAFVAEPNGEAYTVVLHHDDGSMTEIVITPGAEYLTVDIDLGPEEPVEIVYAGEAVYDNR